MRLIYFFISVFFCSIICFKTSAQADSLSKINIIGELKPDTTQKQPSQVEKKSTEVLLDTINPKKDSASLTLAKKDSLLEKKHIPRKATLRSAIIPGWGQAYNHEYWKIPIVYGALAIPGSLFAYNNKWYQHTKNAYNILVNGGDTLSIDPKLRGLSSQSLQYYRNTFRRDRDYSVLFFLLAWALQVADATVFAHLKDFDVSNNLSLNIKPDYNISNNAASLSLAFNLKSKPVKTLRTSF